MIHIRNNRITLLEVMIAMGLTTVILTALMSVYSQIETTHQEIAKVRRHTFYTLYLQQRLTNVISYAKIRKDAPWFYSSHDYEQPSLIFVYDNGVDAASFFSGEVLGKLFVDGQRKLILATWPLPNKNFSSPPPMRKEVLAENVQGLSLQFFVPPQKENSMIPAALEGERDWITSWPIEMETLPPIIKLHLTIQDEPLVFAFALPHTAEIIQYP